jgi:hypothetical protein
MADEASGKADAFAQFKAGVAAQVSPRDADTHFDLAVAYAEMGLVREAMDELAIVLEADPRHLRARAAMVELRLRAAGAPDGPADGAA